MGARWYTYRASKMYEIGIKEGNHTETAENLSALREAKTNESAEDED